MLKSFTSVVIVFENQLQVSFNTRYNENVIQVVVRQYYLPDNGREISEHGDIDNVIVAVVLASWDQSKDEMRAPNHTRPSFLPQPSITKLLPFSTRATSHSSTCPCISTKPSDISCFSLPQQALQCYALVVLFLFCFSIPKKEQSKANGQTVEEFIKDKVIWKSKRHSMSCLPKFSIQGKKLP